MAVPNNWVQMTVVAGVSILIISFSL